MEKGKSEFEFAVCCCPWGVNGLEERRERELKQLVTGTK